jgi:Amt family ammonium transporter
LGYDDTLDVFGIHGVAGIVGAIGLTFFLRDVPEAGLMTQLGHQAAGVGVAILASAIGTILLLILVEKTVGLKLDERQELAGLDHSLHGEYGYGMINPN